MADLEGTELRLAPPGQSSRARIAGWPPVRSYQQKAWKTCSFVKVAVKGAPYLRKVDLKVYAGYRDLLTGLERMFSFLASRPCLSSRPGLLPANWPDLELVDIVTGAEYVPTYEDKDGDWMLVGDVPWPMFVETCRRLRLVKRSDKW